MWKKKDKRKEKQRRKNSETLDKYILSCQRSTEVAKSENESSASDYQSTGNCPRKITKGAGN